MDELLVRPSLEQELEIERRVRDILEMDDKKELADLAVALLKQNWAQNEVLTSCFDKIHLLEARIICMNNPVKKQKSPWWMFWTN